MSYSIYNSDGSLLTNIPVGGIDDFTTSLTLLGKNINSYGQYLNTNLIKLLTNSASTGTTSPNNPQTGQLWFNKTTNRLTVYNGTAFQPTYGSHVSGVAPTTSTIAIGDFWYDTVNTQLKLWDGDSFNLVGPATSGLLGTFGVVPSTTVIRDYYSNVIQKVGYVYSHGSSIGIISSATFTGSPADIAIMLPSSSKAATNIADRIVAGVTVINDLEVLGHIYINGWDVQYHANVDLTTNYDITTYGTYTATLASSYWGNNNTNFIAYNAANYAISRDLAKMFKINYYSPGSQVSVLCKFNNEISIRKFQLQKIYSQQTLPQWEPYTIYPYAWTGTATTSQLQAVSQVTWLWTSTGYTNVIQDVWNEVIRTDSTSSTSTSFLDPVTVNSTFFVKIAGGIPNTGFTYAGVAPFDYFAGTQTLDAAGEYTTNTSITNTIQPVVTTATYTVNFTFPASNNTRQLVFTALRP